MRFLSLLRKRKVAEPTFDDELLHLTADERSLLQSLDDEQCRMFEKWNRNRKKARKENMIERLKGTLQSQASIFLQNDRPRRPL